MRAIFVADVHLQARAPIARSPEPDWFAAMSRPLREIKELAEEHNCPVLYAGDIFDRWNAPAEVINFALEELPKGYAVPGQHDLPNHNYGHIKKSAYWTLCRAGLLTNIEPGESVVVGEKLIATGWPWGFAPCPCQKTHPHNTHIALVHAFIYTRATGYPGAPVAERINAYKTKLQGYDVGVFGDNHKGFIRTTGNTTIANCGGVMRRRVDERDYKPGVCLLHSDGTVTRHHFSTATDVMIDLTGAEEVVGRLLNMTDFVGDLRGLGAADAMDFVEALKRFIKTNNITENVAKLIRAATER